MGLSDTVSTNPARSVLFNPEGPQQLDLVIENNGEKQIMFKMKSTRPGIYKMRPVYDAIPPGKKRTVKLIFKGIPKNQKVPLSDRFTMVYTIAPSTTTKVDKMWSQHKFQAKMVDQEITKKHIAVLFKGVNDHIPLKDTDMDEEQRKTAKINRGKGLIEEPPQEQAGPKGPKILIMFRQQDWGEDSETDEEDDEDVKESNDQEAPTAIDFKTPSSTNLTKKSSNLNVCLPKKSASNLNASLAKKTASIVNLNPSLKKSPSKMNAAVSKKCSTKLHPEKPPTSARSCVKQINPVPKKL